MTHWERPGTGAFGTFGPVAPGSGSGTRTSQIPRVQMTVPAARALSRRSDEK
jgi:hypothetical protein